MTTKLYNLVLLLVLLTLTGCSSIEKIEQPLTSDLTTLSNENMIGQTYVARYDGLDGFQIYVEPDPEAQGTAQLQLSEGPEESNVLRTVTIDLADVTSPGYLHFQFLPVKDSNQKYYYIRLEMDGAGSLRVGISNGDSYINGAMYQNQIPQDAQLAFNLSYDPIQVASGLLQEGLTWILWVLIGIFLYIIPGWALLGLLWPGWGKLHWGEKLGLSAGVSLAIYPIIFLWTHLIGLSLGPLYAWIPPIAGLIVIIWKNRKEILLKRIPTPITLSPFPWSDFTLLLVIGLIFVVRFWVIRGLDAPMWGDSYQHTMIAQLLVDNNGLFNSWEPYVPYYSITVHFGFHTAVAVLAWITRMDLVTATLLSGQILNVLAVLALIPLGIRFSHRSRWAGIGVAIVAGLLIPMPAHYVNWGRYPQLAGQVILPVAVWLLWESASENLKIKIKSGRSIKVRITLLTSLVIAGMLLSYYRMAFFFIAFVIAWVIICGIPRWRLKLSAWIEVFVLFAPIAVMSLVLVLPWIIRLTGSNLANAVESGIKISSPWIDVLADYQVWRDLTYYSPSAILFLSIIALASAFLRKNWGLFILPLWFLILSASIAGRLFHLPGAYLMQNFAIIIAVYIPIGLLVGWLIDDASRAIEIRLKNISSLLIFLCISLLAVWGAWNLHSISKPDKFALVTRPDMHAMKWIRENTSEGTNFLVEGFRIYGGRTAVGSDAGWWISLLTIRENSIPPQYALMNERPSPPDYSHNVIQLITDLENVSLASTEGIQSLCDYRINHVYIGQGQGKVGAGAQQLFAPEELIENPFFDLIYRQDRVYIFALKQDYCGGNG